MHFIPSLLASFIAFGALAKSTQEEPQPLIYFSAGHLKGDSKDSRLVRYTVTSKSNQVSVRIYENLLHGHFKKVYSLNVT